jgi:hypothetical protein
MDAYHQIYCTGKLSPLLSNCQNSSAINEYIKVMTWNLKNMHSTSKSERYLSMLSTKKPKSRHSMLTEKRA